LLFPFKNSLIDIMSQERVQKIFCTTREASEILGVSLRTAQLWVESGLLEAWKTSGGHRRISRDSVERLLFNPALRSGARAAATNDPAPATGESPTPLSILVVEDSAALRRLYELTMARWPLPVRVVTASDGHEALIRLGLHRPDLLIADLNMPKLDGFHMLEAIRATPELNDMAIVAVTGLEPREVLERGGVPEGVRVLPKPVPFAELLVIATEVAASRVAHDAQGNRL
jgi:excisionase family DNA binding protein